MLKPVSKANACPIYTVSRTPSGSLIPYKSPLIFCSMSRSAPNPLSHSASKDYNYEHLHPPNHPARHHPRRPRPGRHLLPGRLQREPGHPRALSLYLVLVGHVHRWAVQLALRPDRRWRDRLHCKMGVGHVPRHGDQCGLLDHTRRVHERGVGRDAFVLLPEHDQRGDYVVRLLLNVPLAQRCALMSYPTCPRGRSYHRLRDALSI
ncbi:hypothetical protein K466DRAFT_209930 [Polyporus arcularius HHB13444]|uniref:Uncharacterized protein n=1 Tax=Polyporus arcularius HHB13444 TaxID=1314778 RepID=A0A5C3P595_9APHY|nr:hypothetical protein K466DRAFT_209930 [Polyporus arcularius HHB13444]